MPTPQKADPSNPSLTAADFLKLAAQSSLFTPQQCRKLQVQYQQAAVGTGTDTAQPLAQWLVAQKHLTRYQAKVLLAGKPGPFLYGAYKVLERTGDGPFKGCFRAVHLSSGHAVLLQFLTGEQVKDPRRWLTTVAGLTRVCLIDGPRLHRWYEWVDLGQFKFLVTEDLSGRPLREVLREGRLPHERACYVALQAAEGLLRVHQAGLVHADVRPDQLWLDANGQLKVLLHPIVPATRLSPADEPLQAEYRAPELANANRAPDVQTDIYALGCTLYELLSGRPPFAGGDLTAKRQRHATEPIQPLENFKVPAAVGQVVAYMMAKHPGVRFKQMSEVAAQLSPLTGAEAHLLPPSVPPPTLASYQEYLDLQPWKAAAQATPPVAPAVPLAPVAQVPPAPVTAAAPVAAATPETQPGESNRPPAARPVAMPAAPRIAIEIRADDRRKKPVRRKKSSILVLVLLLAAIAAGGFYGWYNYREQLLSLFGKDQQQQSSSGGSSSADDPAADSGSTSGSSAAVIKDDGKSLWASPTSGQPINLAAVPADSKLTLVLRPADLLAHPEGSRLLKALGPAIEQLAAQIEVVTKVPLADTEQLIISLHEAPQERINVALVVRLRKATERAKLLADWGNPALKNDLGGEYYQGAEWSFYLATAGEEKQEVKEFTVGAEAQIKSVIEQKGLPPLPHAGMEALIRSSDSQRLITLLFVPQFLRSTLLRDGRELYFGSAQRLRGPVDAFLGDGVRAGMLSVHLQDHCYVELALSTDVSRDRYGAASDLRKNLLDFPTEIEDYLATLVPPAYWRKVAIRLPKMFQFLADNARVGVEDKLVIANVVLPTEAAHNLAFGSEMLLASQAGPVTEATASAAPPPMKGPKTIEELLALTSTFRSEKISLEFAVRDIAEDIRNTYPQLPFEFEIKIIGEDLQKDGITRNQQVNNFDVQNKPLAELLTALVMRCNPITTVEKPSEADQKLVWVVGEDPSQAGRRIILITTRDGAATRQISLPAVFQLQQ